jgi:hypothetical protein
MSKEQKATTDTSTADSKRPRHRSPNYPTVGLRDAVNRLREFYKADGKAGALPEIAAVHIGFSKPHGQAMSVLSALKKFGLVQEHETNGRVAPTQRGIEILNLAENDPRRIQALNEAVIAPEIYRQIIEQYRQTGFPSNDAMERELVTYKAFNPNAVGAFVRDLKDSLEFAGITDIGTVDLENAEEVESKGGAMETQVRPPAAPSPVERALKIANPIAAHSYIWPLSKDVTAQLLISGESLESSHIETLQQYLNIVKTILKADGK